MLTILRCGQIPIGSMYGIYANIWGILMVNVTIYSIHGSYGIWWSWVFSWKLGSPFNRVLKFDLCCHRNHRIPKNAHDIPHIVACKNILEYVPSPNHNNHIIWKFINPHFLFVENSVTIMMMPKFCHWYPISIYIPCESHGAIDMVWSSAGRWGPSPLLHHHCAGCGSGDRSPGGFGEGDGSEHSNFRRLGWEPIGS